MSKMSQISAEMDEQNVPLEKRNSLISRVSEGMHAAEKKIDTQTRVDVVVQAKKKDAGKTSVEQGTLDIASKIRDFADKTHNVVTIDGKSYVKAGVYQYVAHLMSVVPEFDFEPESTQEEVWCISVVKK